MSNAPIIEKNLIIEGPNITQEDKQSLISDLTALEKKLNKYLSNLDLITDKIFSEIELDLYNCEKKYNHIDIELKPFSQTVKDKYSFLYLKSKMKQMKNNFKELETKINDKLFNNIENEEYQRLLVAHNNADFGLKNIQNSIKMINNTNNSDNNTMESLKRQSDIIMNTNVVLNNTQAYIQKSSLLIKKMICAYITNKIALIGIIIFLGLIDFWLLLRKFIK